VAVEQHFRADPSGVIFNTFPRLSPSRAAMNELYLADETECVERLLDEARLDDDARRRVVQRARQLVEAVRANADSKGGIEAFLHQYDLSSQEGMVLMCLAEALIRIPDDDTADRLIRDKLASGKWQEHLGASSSLFVNASTWGLMLTGRVLKLDREAEDLGNFMNRTVSRLGEPVVRTALRQAMRIMGHQFVMGRTIKEALKRGESKGHRAYRHSFDMLGEAALMENDAQAFFDAYAGAIDAIGEAVETGQDVFSAPGISVKLSALHPRYEFARREITLDELAPRLLKLAERAAKAGIALTVDAEEADRLDLSLDVFERVYRSDSLDGWEGFGLAVQAYQKRAIRLIDWLADLGGDVGRRIPVRLVKGAYWDTEVKIAQMEGLTGYPVFTRKPSTDVSYLACARKLLDAGEALYPQFATHNAHTLASVLEMAGDRRDFEFQRLHGMGEELYGEVVGPDKLGMHCRVYAPVGRHKELLPYLVRRLLENGANTSFVNRIVDEGVPIEDIVSDPVATVEGLAVKPHPRIPSPRDIYGDDRANSRGINLSDVAELEPLAARIDQALEQDWRAAPTIGGRILSGVRRSVNDPADRRRHVGEVLDADEGAVDRALDLATAAQPGWDALSAAKRADILLKAAELYEKHTAELMALAIREAGKSVVDAIAEVREAVDFLRYYSLRCRRDFGEPLKLPGYTGERNELSLHGRGVFVCISPWNFPLAIFTGQVTAALAAGNCVLAKPAEQTSLIGALAVNLMHQAGVPGDVLHFVPGQGGVVGAAAVADERVAGVAFTGSTETAKLIHTSLANRKGAIPALIAETGGQNAMLVDSSALPEQVVADVIESAFHSAGQRCSALRVLFVQEDIAPRVVEILAGYMKTLKVGDPALLATDVGPVIDDEALENLKKHADWIKQQGRAIGEAQVPHDCANGSFLAPLAIEIDRLDILKREVFGPILHVIRYKSRDLDKVIDAINETGYGLTLGVHSRIDSQALAIQRRVRVGNAYINRNMVGAVVGVQPFGGQGLSGTGPKAGGPHYLLRYATERTVTINTAALGGNATLLSLSE
jgi:RHH-type proline utilization regulon transcriptional repressor/proline dehydrogenase/delta 1-pyrroline-5-carboxylate dehydrogenase